MTDNEIIKALEQHIERTKNIKYGARKKTLVDAELLKDILDLINRQNAEIERLQGLLSEWKKEAYKLADSKDEHFKICDEYAEKAKQRYSEMFDEAKGKIKAEAVKEFAERLKEKVESYDVYDGYKITIRFAVEEDTIDKLVKEMAGEG